MVKQHILLMMVLFAYSTAYASDILFAPSVEYQTGNMPRSIVVGDFNSDGKVDLATANYSSSNVSLHLGIGDGTFETKQDYPVDGRPMGLISDDFNNDGQFDLATANFAYNNTVSALIGNGDGSFQPRIDSNAGRFPYSIDSGDFNNDGIVDVVVSISIPYPSWSEAITLLLGNGDGSFRSSSSYRLGGEGLWSDFPPVAAGDFNGDGKLDVVTATISPNLITILLGNGDGTIKSRIDYNAPGAVTGYFFKTGDFNKDGKTDIVWSPQDFGMYVMNGHGDGTFEAPIKYSVPHSVGAATTGDFDSDGNIDLAIAGSYTNAVTILRGNGNGVFQAPSSFPTKKSNFYTIAAGDFNGDGKMDLATASYLTNTVEILLNITPNQPPIADAGQDPVIECAGPTGSLVALNASGTSDPDGDSLTYAWTWNGGSAEGVNPSVTLPLGTTTITLTVSDGKSSATDTVNVTVRDTTPPVTSATGGSDAWYNTNVISAFTSYDSCSGVKEIHYSVDGHETIAPGNSASLTLSNDGVYEITYFAVDNAGNIEVPKNMKVMIDKTPPVLNLSAGQSILWPPNHKMVDVNIGGGASDGTSGLSSVTFTVTDEYGKVEPEITGFYQSVPLEAWREGTDMDGRHYTITAVATDAAGNKTTASTMVSVPHDQRK